jgi:hypothetical protein
MRRRNLVLTLAAIWGAFATWIFWWFFPTIFGLLLRASEPSVRALSQSGWSPESLSPYLVHILDVIAALIYGLIFGVPLAFVGRHLVLPAWEAFAVAFVATIGVRIWLVDGSLANLFNGSYPTTLVAVLLWALLTLRVRSAHAARRAA